MKNKSHREREMIRAVHQLESGVSSETIARGYDTSSGWTVSLVTYDVTMVLGSSLKIFRYGVSLMSFGFYMRSQDVRLKTVTLNVIMVVIRVVLDAYIFPVRCKTDEWRDYFCKRPHEKLDNLTLMEYSKKHDEERTDWYSEKQRLLRFSLSWYARQRLVPCRQSYLSLRSCSMWLS